MTIFKKWILRKSDEIRAKEKAEREAEIKTIEDFNEKSKLHRRQLRTAIESEIEKLAAEKMSEPCHIKVGDTAILNYYSIGRESRNGWDGGVSSLLNHIPKEERTAPVKVKITEIYADTSLAYDRVDKFFEYFSYNQTNLIKLDAAWYSYVKWMEDSYSGVKSLPTFDRFGLYKTAKFEYTGSFQPKWGLNIDSFLTEGTPEAEKTFELWSLEIEINQKRSKLAAEMEVLKAEMRKIDEEYINIKYGK